MSPVSTVSRFALMVALFQIVDGALGCDFCDQPATLGIATGADTDKVPCCYTHAMDFVATSSALAARLSGVTSE